MNFKIFHVLIITHLISERWRIVGHPVPDIHEEFSKILVQFPSEIVEPYKKMRDDLLVLKGQVKNMKEAHNEAWRLLNNAHEENYKKLKQENQELQNEKQYLKGNYTEYQKIRAGLKLRDAVADIETKQFPLWLKVASIHRYFKWLIALIIVKTPFFDEVRQQIHERKITKERFATVICEIHDKISDLFAHNVPIEKPTCSEIKTFCYRFLRKDDTTDLACETLAKTVSIGRDTIDLDGKSTTRYWPTINIIIREVSKAGGVLTNRMDELKNEIEKIKKFRDFECNIIESAILEGYEVTNTQYGREIKLLLPCFFLRVGHKIDLLHGAYDERASNYKNFEGLKEAIHEKIAAELNTTPNQIIISDDDYDSRLHNSV